LILRGPERGPSRHVHYLELDQIIGEKYVVTVHGPINPTVPLDIALRETDGVRKRIEAGRLRPDSTYELSYAIEGEREYLQGVIESYRARARAKMTVAAERLAVIAVVTLRITGTVLDLRHEHHRQRHHPRHPAGRGAGDHDGHVGRAAGWAKRRGWW
jgi:hypothetical protein